jgi:hypothetical protein
MYNSYHVVAGMDEAAGTGGGVEVESVEEEDLGVDPVADLDSAVGSVCLGAARLGARSKNHSADHNPNFRTEPDQKSS